MEKVNVDFEGSRKEFWAFVGRRTKVLLPSRALRERL